VTARTSAAGKQAHDSGVQTDYDQLAPRYDEDRKGIEHGHSPFVEGRLREGARGLAVLDLGCGTGRWLAAQLAHFVDLPVRWVGADPSAGMLAVARRNAPGAELVRAGAEAIPYPDAAFDLVCSTTSFHHFDDKERGLDEIVRVLRPRGEFHLGNIDPWGMRRWWPHVYFPEGWALDEARFWPVERLAAGLQRRGLRVSHELHASRQPTTPAVMLEIAERRVLSQLAALDDAAYARGLARLRELVAQDPGQAIETESAWLVLTARKVS
jgi:SAM-dependent methyltransferase